MERGRDERKGWSDGQTNGRMEQSATILDGLMAKLMEGWSKLQLD